MSSGNLGSNGGMIGGNSGGDNLSASSAGNPSFNADRNDVTRDIHDIEPPVRANGDNGEACRQLNSFLRGEISAAETYKMAMDKMSSEQNAAVSAGMLREIQEEHGRAAQAIRDRIRELGGEPSDSSGAWGTWAKTVQGTMNLFGDASALKSLKEGEEHGLKDYQEGLDDIDGTSADLVSNQLIPSQQRHINLLDQLINSAGHA